MQDEAIRIFCSTSDSSRPLLRWIFNKDKHHFHRHILYLLGRKFSIYLPIITKEHTIGIQHWHYLENDVIPQHLGDGVRTDQKVH